MTNSPVTNDPRAIWKTQGKARTPISAREIRFRVERRRTKVRLEGIAGSVLSLAAVVYCIGVIVMSPAARIIAVVAAILLLGGLAREVYVSRGGNRIWPWLPKTEISGEVPAPLIAFYRKGLERQRRGYATPSWDLILMFWVLVVSYIRLRNSIPLYFYVLVVICMVLMFYLRIRRAHQLRKEIEELAAFESEHFSPDEPREVRKAGFGYPASDRIIEVLETLVRRVRTRRPRI